MLLDYNEDLNDISLVNLNDHNEPTIPKKLTDSERKLIDDFMKSKGATQISNSQDPYGDQKINVKERLQGYKL